MNSFFAKEFASRANETVSENGGKVYRSTGSGALLDAFATLGGMRNRSDRDIVDKWVDAYNENPDYAARLVLYARDCRGGMGERKIGRLLLRELAKRDPEKVKRNFDLVVLNGRWDDLFVLFGTSVEKAALDFMKNQLAQDCKDAMENKPVSLLAKWLKSENTSSKESRALATKTRTYFGLDSRSYRKTLSGLRKYLDVLERKMSAGQWNEINFEHIPSVAMSKYVNCFNKRCAESFAAYKAKLVKGETKVNAATLFPSDIVLKKLNGRSLDIVDEEQWKALPNYVNGEFDVVVMADVSGSMFYPNEPAAASIGLATYFAQRNKGAYHNLYMSFTNDAHFIQLCDSWSLTKCIDYVKANGVGYNTNLDNAFSEIYNVAIKSRETPKALIIISDGEFDRCATGVGKSIIRKWNDKFIEAGLNPIKVISWNVACRHDTVIAPATDEIAYCSGYSASTFKNLFSYITKSPYEAMIEVLSDKKYCWK